MRKLLKKLSEVYAASNSESEEEKYKLKETRKDSTKETKLVSL